MDELVSFVSEKWFKRWLWTAQCRRTRQIIAYAIGDRSETTARQLWQESLPDYQACPVFTDEFNVSPLIFPPEQHHPVSKGSGLTNHQERWYKTLRQWVGRYTRRTLSFSKRMNIIRSYLTSSFSNIISAWLHHLPSDHYPIRCP
jgi:IS1 family transposase